MFSRLIIVWQINWIKRQCRSRNCPGFDLSILRHSGIRGAAGEAVLNKALVKKLDFGYGKG